MRTSVLPPLLTHPNPQPSQSKPKNTQLAQPPPEIVASLEALCDDPNNLVFVISGRRKDDLEARLVLFCRHVDVYGCVYGHV